MSDDDYMKDPNYKSVGAVIEALNIFAKYMENGHETRFFCGAEHDELFIYVSTEKLPEDSEDGVRLGQLGFYASDDGWSYFT